MAGASWRATRPCGQEEVVAKIASVVFFVATARVLGEESFGDFMFAISFTTVLFVVSGFGTEELLAREVSRERSTVHHFLSNTVAVKAVSRSPCSAWHFSS